MSLVIPDEFINLHFGYRAEGDPELQYTALGFAMVPGQTHGNWVSNAASIWEAWRLQFKALLPETFSFTGAYVELGAPTPPYVRVDLSGTTVGEGLSFSLPTNCAILINKSTSLAGRAGRGRMYVPGIQNNACETNGVLAGPVHEAWQDAVTAFIGDVDALGEFVTGGVLLHDEDSPAEGPTSITALVVNHKIATQRRRMRP